MAGLASFVNGVFDGMDWREARDDRKRTRKMDDERFTWERSQEADRDETHDWDREQQGWRREDAGHVRDERSRTKKEREEEEAFWKDLANGMGDGSEAPAEADAAQPATEAPRRVPEPPRSSPRRIAMPADQASPAMPQDGAAPLGTLAPQPVGNPVAAQAAPAGQRRIASVMPPTAAPVVSTQVAPVPPVAPPGSYATPDGQVIDELRPPLVDPAGPSDPYARLSPELRAEMFAGQPAAPTVSTAAPVAPAMPMASDPGIALPGNAAARVAPPRSMMPVLANSPALAPDVRAEAQRRARVEASVDPRAAPVLGNAAPVQSVPPGPTPEPAAMPADGLPVAKDVPPGVTPVTEAGTPQPSLTVAAQTTPEPRRMSGAANGQIRVDEARAKRAESATLKMFDDEASAKVMKFYVSKGQPEKADAFMKWIGEQKVRDGMRLWARAVHAATVGDDQTFVDAVAGAYNANGYYDDGFSIVRDQSGINRDEAGNIVGGTVTFRNEQSGETFAKEFTGTEDLYAMGIDMLSPEQVFEIGYSRIEAARAVRDEAAKSAATKAAAAAVGVDTSPTAVLAAMEQLSKVNTNFAMLPIEEQRAQAIAFLNGGAMPGAGVSSGPPVKYRP